MAKLLVNNKYTFKFDKYYLQQVQDKKSDKLAYAKQLFFIKPERAFYNIR